MGVEGVRVVETVVCVGSEGVSDVKELTEVGTG